MTLFIMVIFFWWLIGFVITVNEWRYEDDVKISNICQSAVIGLFGPFILILTVMRCCDKVIFLKKK